MNVVTRLADRTRGIRPSQISQALRAGVAPGVIPLTVGSPAPELLPVAELGEAMGRLGAAALSYGPPEGHPPLREFVASRLGTCSPSDVLVTNGSQQALDLIGRMLLDPGCAVVVERPSYLGAIDAFRQYGAEFVPVSMDADGLCVDELERVLAADTDRRIRLVYTMPNFHNPTGRTLSVARKEPLVRLAQRYGVPLVEDDAYAELTFEPRPRPTLKSMDDSGIVLSLGSMSKVLAPGLRVGWVVADAPYFRHLVALKERSDLLSALGPQVAAVEVCQDGGLDRHLAEVVPCYRERRDAMVAAIDDHFGGAVVRTDPAGGFFVWLDFPSSVDTADLLAVASRRKVLFVPGHDFHVDGTGGNTMRLGYAGVTPAQIREGVRRLADAAAASPLAQAG